MRSSIHAVVIHESLTAASEELKDTTKLLDYAAEWLGKLEPPPADRLISCLAKAIAAISAQTWRGEQGGVAEPSKLFPEGELHDVSKWNDDDVKVVYSKVTKVTAEVLEGATSCVFAPTLLTETQPVSKCWELRALKALSGCCTTPSLIGRILAPDSRRVRQFDQEDELTLDYQLDSTQLRLGGLATFEEQQKTLGELFHSLTCLRFEGCCLKTWSLLSEALVVERSRRQKNIVCFHLALADKLKDESHLVRDGLRGTIDHRFSRAIHYLRDFGADVTLGYEPSEPCYEVRISFPLVRFH